MSEAQRKLRWAFSFCFYIFSVSNVETFQKYFATCAHSFMKGVDIYEI